MLDVRNAIADILDCTSLADVNQRVDAAHILVNDSPAVSSVKD
jgi:hypothetical protein